MLCSRPIIIIIIIFHIIFRGYNFSVRHFSALSRSLSVYILTDDDGVIHIIRREENYWEKIEFARGAACTHHAHRRRRLRRHRRTVI